MKTTMISWKRSFGKKYEWGLSLVPAKDSVISKIPATASRPGGLYLVEVEVDSAVSNGR